MQLGVALGWPGAMNLDKSMYLDVSRGWAGAMYLDAARGGRGGTARCGPGGIGVPGIQRDATIYRDSSIHPDIARLVLKNTKFKGSDG